MGLVMLWAFFTGVFVKNHTPCTPVQITTSGNGACPVANEVQSYLLRDHHGRIDGKLRFAYSGYLHEMLTYAINAYGFLIERNELLSPAQFIARIRSAYDCEGEPRNRAVVDALAQLV